MTSTKTKTDRGLLSSAASSGLQQIQKRLSPRVQDKISKYMGTTPPPPQDGSHSAYPPPGSQHQQHQNPYGYSNQNHQQTPAGGLADSYYGVSSQHLHPQQQQQQQQHYQPPPAHYHQQSPFPQQAAAPPPPLPSHQQKPHHGFFNQHNPQPSPQKQKQLHQSRDFIFTKSDLSYTVAVPSSTLASHLPSSSSTSADPIFMYIDSQKSRWYQNSPKSMTIYRPTPSDRKAQQIGSVRYHDSTSLKADFTLNGAPVRKWSKKLDSSTGLGQLKWSKDHIGGITSSGTVLKCETKDGTLVAKFATGGKAAQLGGFSGGSASNGFKEYWHQMSGKNNGGRLVIYREGLNREQVEEVVASGIVEHERKIKEKQIMQASGGGGSDAVGSVVGAVAGG